MAYMGGGINVGTGQGGRPQVPNRNPNQYGTEDYNEPITGAASPFPTVGVSPETQYNAAAALKMSQQGAQQASDARNDIFSKYQSMSGGGQPQATYGGAGGADVKAAEDAIMARAKDRAGLISKSAMTGLRDSMASRGLLGSGIEGEESAKIMGGAAGGLGELNREQMIQGVQGAQHAADTQFQGDITQRGQNLQALQGLLATLQASGRVY